MLSCCFTYCTFCFVLFFAVVSPKAALSSWGWETKAPVSEDVVVCPEQAAPSYLSSAKVPIDWSADCASVSLPVQPSLPDSPPSPPSIHPPSSLPSAQGLIDQPCPGSCPLISQLDVFCVWVKWINYWANRTGSVGPGEPVLGPWMQDWEGQRDGRGKEEGMQVREKRGEMKWRVREAKRRGRGRPTGSVISKIRETAHKRVENEEMLE